MISSLPSLPPRQEKMSFLDTENVIQYCFGCEEPYIGDLGVCSKKKCQALICRLCPEPHIWCLWTNDRNYHVGCKSPNEEKLIRICKKSS